MNSPSCSQRQSPPLSAFGATPPSNQYEPGERSSSDDSRDLTLEIAEERGHRAWMVNVGTSERSQARRVCEGESLVLGSGPCSDIRIRDRSISRRHCRIWVQGARIFVEDLGSTNGIYVGGARVAGAQLGAGVGLVLGRAVVSCAIPTAEDEEDEAPVEPFPGVIAGSSAMRRVIREIKRLARLRAPVLLHGETGTGKDVLARTLHREGPRRSRPFVALNVGALPRELAEAELFGYEKGAFTGAFAARDGAFLEAHGGTLFLDEIAELTPDLQVKLLRVLEDFEIRKLGGRGSRRVDVRITSATWAPLGRRVEEGRFRPDLYQRLAVFVVDVPPLRERASDILALAERTLLDIRDEVGPRELTSGAAARLADYRWPGNVRELRNVVYRAAVKAKTERIRAADIASSLSGERRRRRGSVSPEDARAFMEDHGGSVSEAARQLGVPRSTLRGWIKS